MIETFDPSSTFSVSPELPEMKCPYCDQPIEDYEHDPILNYQQPVDVECQSCGGVVEVNVQGRARFSKDRRKVLQWYVVTLKASDHWKEGIHDWPEWSHSKGNEHNPEKLYRFCNVEGCPAYQQADMSGKVEYCHPQPEE